MITTFLQIDADATMGITVMQVGAICKSDLDAVRSGSRTFVNVGADPMTILNRDGETWNPIPISAKDCGGAPAFVAGPIGVDPSSVDLP